MRWLLLVTLLFGLTACDDSSSQTEAARLTILSSQTDGSTSTELGNFAATAVKEVYELDFAFLPSAFYSSPGKLARITKDLTPSEINDVMRYFPRNPQDQILLGTMQGKHIKNFLVRRSEETYSVDVETAGLWYNVTFEGGIVDRGASLFTLGGLHAIDDDRYYRIAISDDFYFGSAFPGYKFRNNFNFHFRRERYQQSIREAVRKYLTDSDKYVYPEWSRTRARVSNIVRNDIGFKTIPQIQGPGHSAPDGILAHVVTTEGIITAVGSDNWYPYDLDIYIQTETPDNDPRTSEGLHITSRFNNVELKLGDKVRLKGFVIEEMRTNGLGETTLFLTEPPSIVDRGLDLPEAVTLANVPTDRISEHNGQLMLKQTLDVQRDGIDFWESVEGMRVKSRRLVVSGFRGGGEDLLPISNRFYLNLYVYSQDAHSENLLSRSAGLMPDFLADDHNPELFVVTTNHLSHGIQVERDRGPFYSYNIGDEIANDTYAKRQVDRASNRANARSNRIFDALVSMGDVVESTTYLKPYLNFLSDTQDTLISKPGTALPFAQKLEEFESLPARYQQDLADYEVAKAQYEDQKAQFEATQAALNTETAGTAEINAAASSEPPTAPVAPTAPPECEEFFSSETEVFYACQSGESLEDLKELFNDATLVEKLADDLSGLKKAYDDGDCVGVMTYPRNLFGGGEYALVLPEAQQCMKYNEMKTEGFIPVEERPTTAFDSASNPNELTLATLNLENLAGNRQDRIDALASVFTNNLKCPDLINLVEIQDNNGISLRQGANAEVTLKKVLVAIQQDCPYSHYDYINIDPFEQSEGGQPGGNIRIAVMYNQEKLSFTPRGEFNALLGGNTEIGPGGQLTLNPGRLFPISETFDRARRSPVMQFKLKNEAQTDVYLIGAHLNSKLGDVDPWGGTQPFLATSDGRRSGMAVLIRNFVERLERSNPSAHIYVAGDFNALAEEGSMQVLTSDGFLENGIFRVPENYRYTTNHNGNSQPLDYIFMDRTVYSNPCTEIEVLHLNSDFMGRISDHDPVILKTCIGNTEEPEVQLPTEPAATEVPPDFELDIDLELELGVRDGDLDLEVDFDLDATRNGANVF